MALVSSLDRSSSLKMLVGMVTGCHGDKRTALGGSDAFVDLPAHLSIMDESNTQDFDQSKSDSCSNEPSQSNHDEALTKKTEIDFSNIVDCSKAGVEPQDRASTNEIVYLPESSSHLHKAPANDNQESSKNASHLHNENKSVADQSGGGASCSISQSESFKCSQRFSVEKKNVMDTNTVAYLLIFVAIVLNLCVRSSSFVPFLFLVFLFLIAILVILASSSLFMLEERNTDGQS